MRARALASTWLLVTALVAALGLSSPAVAERSGEPGLPLPRSMGGTAALETLGAKVPEVASRNGISAQKLEELLERDSRARLDRAGRLRYVETAPSARTNRMLLSLEGTSQAPSYPYDQTFALHSKPGSTRVIHLDFNGEAVSGTGWNVTDNLPARFYAGWDLDGDPATFSNAERDVIQEVWQRVAEDYAPMDVDVTTEDPGIPALTRSSSTDLRFGMRALVSNDPEPWERICGSECGGVAYVDVFDGVFSQLGEAQPAWIFGNVLGADPQLIADVISHEVGHTLGLHHDGQGTKPYYEGQGVWLPIMGSGWRPLSQFSNGDYTGATNREGDFTVMAQNGTPLRVDDHSNDSTAATLVQSGQPATGVIGDRADVDWFVVDQECAGTLRVTAAPAPAGPNLDIRLRMQSEEGEPLADVDPPARMESGLLVGLAADWQGTVPAGRYLLAVEGVGHGDPLETGYSDYGSRGAFTLAVAVAECPSEPPPPPGPSVPSWPSGITASLSSTAMSVSWKPPRDIGSAPLTRYEVRRGKGSWIPVAVTAERRHTFRNLLGSTSYQVSVRAVNRVGAGPAIHGAYTTPHATRPNRPRRVTAYPGAKGGAVTARLTWWKPTSNGGAVIHNYRVTAHRLVSGRVVSRKVKTVAGSARATWMFLDRGRYRFTVVALTEAGRSNPSLPSNRVDAR